MTIENLKEFFSQIGYNWTGKIFDPAWHVVPFGSEDQNFAPQTFEEILQYEQECAPIPYFVFTRKDERGEQIDFEYSFRVIPERFISYYYDISGDPEGSESTLTQQTDYTEQWLECQKGLNVGCQQ